MFRFILWSLLALFLMVVGAFPAAAAPITLAATGAAAVVAAIPGPALLLIAVVVYLRHRTAAPVKTATA